MKSREEILTKIAEIELAKRAPLPDSMAMRGLKLAMGGEAAFRVQYERAQDTLIDLLKWVLDE